jgi:hypothetical protein
MLLSHFASKLEEKQSLLGLRSYPTPPLDEPELFFREVFVTAGDFATNLLGLIRRSTESKTLVSAEHLRDAHVLLVTFGAEPQVRE